MELDEELASCITVEDEEALRSRYASPRFLPVLDQLDRSCRLFIAHSPIVIIGSTQPDNGIDISPRGDAPGFVRVLDDHTLVIPDRQGNNRLDSMTNLLVNNEIGLFFMIPGVHETLRIKGTARLSREPEHLAATELQGKQSNTVIVVTVTWVFIHCGKALNRSKIWENDYRASPKAWLLARSTLENSTVADIDLRKPPVVAGHDSEPGDV
ncbi:MAG TPA: MSMEG_1061 family FMN-dependent PPOX-type flavoprotein [Candidatus Angelobacter sp.]|nr:MSMEG_1061 family FMN-dependent PPOX-type flavoprotein [Candidatus Angelobacter sp.]